MYRRILVPTNGETGGQSTFERGLGLDEDAGQRRAFERALSMAEREGAELHLLLFDGDGGGLQSPSTAEGGGMLLREQAATSNNGAGLLRRLTERANENGVRTIARNCEGDETYEILQYVHENEVDAVVVDTQEDGIDPLACRTLRHAGIDVVTV